MQKEIEILMFGHHQTQELHVRISAMQLKFPVAAELVATN